MKLDYDCVRNILLTIESLPFDGQLDNHSAEHLPLLADYSPKKIEYTVKRLCEAGFIPSKDIQTVLSGKVWFSLNELTWDGHQFLDYIRNDDIWNQTKSKMSIVDSLPFKLLITVAAKIIKSSID